MKKRTTVYLNHKKYISNRKKRYLANKLFFLSLGMPDRYLEIVDKYHPEVFNKELKSKIIN